MHIKHILINLLGTICVILGTIGIFLPVLPTTPFILAAAILFAKVNPKFHNWLMNNRLLGPYLENYYNKHGITLAYKIKTCIFLWSGLILSMIIIGDALWLYFLLTVIGLIVTIHVFTIKTK